MQPDLTSTVVGVSGVSIGAATIGLVLRLGARIYVDKRISWEDVLVLICWLAQIAFCTIIITETRYGLGKHWEHFDVTHIDVLLKLITMSSVAYTFALITAKASLAALYLTVFRGRSCLLQTLNQGLLLFFACEAIEETAVVTSQCLPAIGTWSDKGPGTCVLLKPFWWTTFACYMVTNILLFFQPVPFLWHKDLPCYDLVTLVGIVIVGIITCVISLFRQAAVAKIGKDTTYDYVMPYIWSEIDVCVILLFSCGLSVRDILHSSEGLPKPKPPLPRPWARKWPSFLAQLRLPGRAARQSRETVSVPNPFQERAEWLQLIGSYAPHDRRPLGTQVRIEARPPVKVAAAPGSIWRRRERPEEKQEFDEKSNDDGGITVTREVSCTVEHEISPEKDEEEAEGKTIDQSMTSSSGPNSFILSTDSHML